MKPHLQLHFIIILVMLLPAGACNRQKSSSAQEHKTKNLRLVVGKIREVRMAVPTDTTLQLVASSENNEIVDVTKQTTEQVPATRPTEEVFLIKGVTPGTAKVSFARKNSMKKVPVISHIPTWFGLLINSFLIYAALHLFSEIQ